MACELICGDRVAAARFGTAVSVLARGLRSSCDSGQIELALENRGAKWVIVLTFPAFKLESVPEALAEFIEFQGSHAPGEAIATAYFGIHGACASDERTVAEVRAVLLQRSRDELMSDLTASNAELRKSIEDLQRTTTAKERMEGELTIGRDIQMSMLPEDFDAYSHRTEFLIHAALHPAREVGGDFYDFFLIGEERLCICVGDVSGKGVPAALFMAMTKTLIKSRATNDVSPASILTHVNDELGHSNDSCMFVTVWLGILDLNTGKLRFTNAGHNPPFLLHEEDPPRRLAELHGPIVAAVPGMTYGESEQEMTRGDRLLVYTDGITEAMNEKGHLYGEEPLVDCLKGGPAAVKGMVDDVVSRVWEFQGKAEQADDITVMALSFAGASDPATMGVLEFRIASRLEEIAVVLERFQEFAADNGVEDKVRRTTAMAFDELLNNVISYAFVDGPDDAEHSIGVRFDLTPTRLVLTVEDEGVPFNPFAHVSPDTSLPIAERKIGGLGIHLVESMMDETHYTRKIDRNIVTVVKFLNQGEGPIESE
ncbi:MAG: ATP-binding SpoIIE family protein phosphatase [Planctomycetota bacterium]